MKTQKYASIDRRNVKYFNETGIYYHLEFYRNQIDRQNKHCCIYGMLSMMLMMPAEQQINSEQEKNTEPMFGWVCF